MLLVEGLQLCFKGYTMSNAFSAATVNATAATAASYSVGGDVRAVLAGLAAPRGGWSRLLLCRHGETASNKTKLLQGGAVDTLLNERGHKQAEQLALSLAASHVAVHTIATSHLSRAIATADPIAARIPAALRATHVGLGEMLYGELEGKPIAEMGETMGLISKSWREGDTSVRVGGPDGDNPETLLDRALAALRELSHGLPEGATMLVVAHSHLNKALLASLSGAGLSKIHSMPQDNGCLNVIDFNAMTGECNVLHVNLQAESTCGNTSL